MLEIERKFLLDGLPAIPAGAQVHHIEQGYLPESEECPVDGTEVSEGRLRRTTHPDGSFTCTNTFKTGSGLIRHERERVIEPEEFERLWPRTQGARISKTRYGVPDGDLVWEIDAFEEIDLVLAELELPSADTSVTIPAWLAPHIVRDVTDDLEYRNYNLALKLGRRAR